MAGETLDDSLRLAAANTAIANGTTVSHSLIFAFFVLNVHHFIRNSPQVVKFLKNDP